MDDVKDKAIFDLNLSVSRVKSSSCIGLGSRNRWDACFLGTMMTGFLFVTIGSFLLIYYGNVYLSPYWETCSRYEESTCDIKKLTLLQINKKCFCNNAGDPSLYPCYLLSVAVKWLDVGINVYQKTDTFAFHNTDVEQPDTVDKELSFLCSFYSCHCDPVDNYYIIEKRIKSIKEAFLVNETISCYYDPSNPGDVLLEIPSKQTILYLVPPLIIFSIGFVLFTCSYKIYAIYAPTSGDPEPDNEFLD